MTSNQKIRLMLIAATVAVGLISFVCLAGTVLSDRSNERMPIFYHLLYGSGQIVDFDIGAGLVGSLLTMLPFTFMFLMMDLYGLRATPVQHIGFFAIFMAMILLNAAISMLIWLFYGGWGPPAVWQIISATIVISVLAAFVSERRILTTTNPSENAG